MIGSTSARAERLRDLLKGRRLPLLAALIGALLCAPSLGGGLQTEDWVFRAIALGPDMHPPFYINVFGHDVPPPPEVLQLRVQIARDVGILPWITADTFHVSFWRPLSSLTHHLDHRVLDGMPWLMHAHSLLWYALAVFGAALLYRRLLEPGWVAGFAALLYAVDDAHGHPVGWLSNRNGVMAAAFGTLAIVWHDRWRRDGWRPGALLAPLALGAGLLSGELAVSALAYLAAHVALLDPAPLRARWRAVWPWASVAAVWAACWRLQGHGSSSSGVYLDPLQSPLGFLGQALSRAPVLALGQLGAPAADLWVELGPRGKQWLALGGAGAALLAGWALWPLIRRDPRLRFFALGALGALVPACAAFPQDRLLFFVGLGAMPLTAALLAALRERLAGRCLPARALLVAVAASFVALHVVLAPLLLPWRSLTMRRYADRLERAGDSAMAAVSPASEVFLLDAPDFYFGSMVPLVRLSAAQSLPMRMMTLTGTLRGVLLTRLDAHSIELRPARGLLGETFNRIYRPADAGLPEGTVLLFNGVQLRVMQANDAGEPLAVAFRFPWPLEAPQLAFLEWRDGRYQRSVLPATGQSRLLRGSP